ncbi:hypothetical protein HYPSUDRAFT_50090 [Hypholoma sublateritium FD-334 SS-4]|uniref:CCHC-type domain-containing protein n=1 Tax=Hypholoma sublateritium (strain FD-334 SS-4) TaxID=945553 RepID=A0A0D2N0V3_HYPSF|nr:hypothetical protein HYPSUDRAFT_50094 [Hypholoma sublateritium FD-334 SS-4]KJA12824.1 hypothetical protein HYPSUDRAFT_50090 [Hypholoma sublateritium FD-334 SS-4]
MLTSIIPHARRNSTTLSGRRHAIPLPALFGSALMTLRRTMYAIVEMTQRLCGTGSKSYTSNASPDRALMLVGRVTRSMAAIKALRPSHFGLQQLDEELQCMALIRALPSEYNGFVTSLFLLDKLSLTSLRSAFQNQENNTQLRDGPSSGAAVAMKASTPAASTELLCNWCQRKGHLEENCYTKKFSQTRDRKNAAANKGSKGKTKGTSSELKSEKGASAETQPNEETASLALLAT